MEAFHTPVMLNQSVDGLSILPGGVYVDATFGGGGHSSEILKRLQGGRLLAFDQDEEAARNSLADPRFTLVRHNFRYLKNFLRFYGIQSVDGILADLGVHKLKVLGTQKKYVGLSGFDLEVSEHVG